MTPVLPAVGVLHAPFGAAGLRDILQAAQGLCEVTILIRAGVALASPGVTNAARRLGNVIVVQDEMLPLVVSRLKLDGLTTFTDSELDHVDATLSLLDLPGATPGTLSPWDKLAQRQHFAQAGLSNVAAAAVDEPGDLSDLASADRIGLPGVLKPRRGVSAGGIAFLENPADLEFQLSNRSQWQNLLYEQAIPAGSHPAGKPWMADFISVETVSTGAGHHHAAAFDKAPIAHARRAGPDGSDWICVTGDVTPSQLPERIRDIAARHTAAALECLGVRWRVTHTELRVHAGGVEIIEINGRVGGHLNRLLRLLDGPDLIRAALSVAIGAEPQLGEAQSGDYAAGLFPAFPNREAVVRSDVTRSAIRRLKGVVGVDEVAVHGQPAAATAGRLANLTLRASDADELDRLLVDSVAGGLAQLFAADGFDGRAWLTPAA